MHKMFREQTGARMYRLGFEINAKDGHGRTALHLAAMNGHIKIVRQLLSFTVSILFEFTGNEVRKVSATNSPMVTRSAKGRDSPSPGGIACGSAGNGGSDNSSSDTPRNGSVDYDHQEAVEQFHPVEVDRLDLDGNSALHLAVKRSERTQATYRQIALLLLQHGANANKPLISVGGNSSALLQACSNDDVEMMDLLLGNGATDDDHAVLHSSVEMQNDKMIATMLKYQSHVDTEYQVNHSAVAARTQNVTARHRSTVKNIWPNVAVVLNWHGLGLPLVSHAWLNDVCLLHNNVVTDVLSHQMPLAAITRIDVSRNNLSLLPEELFQLPSLRLLSAAENHIRWIPGCEVRIGTDAHKKQAMGDETGIFQCNIDGATDGYSTNKMSSVTVVTATWNAPLLEEVDLQRNQLKDIPADLFKLPSIRKLNVSHNVLEVVPYDMWTSENLVELNLCDNNLKSLPCFRTRPMDHPVSSTDTSSYSNSPQMSHQHGDSERHTPFDYTDAPNGAYEDHPVQLVGQWQHHLSVTMATVCDDVGDGSTRMSRLSELNLSKNALTNVPEGLSCLAPQLSKLDLSHNSITSVGSIQNFPVSVKWIDLSYNNIKRCVLSGCSGEVDQSTEGGSSYMERYSSSRLCYSAFCQTRPTKRYESGKLVFKVGSI